MSRSDRSTYAPVWAEVLRVQQQMDSRRREFDSDCISVGLDHLLRLTEEGKVDEMSLKQRRLAIKRKKTDQARRRVTFKKIMISEGMRIHDEAAERSEAAEAAAHLRLVLTEWLRSRSAPLHLAELDCKTHTTLASRLGLTIEAFRWRYAKERERLVAGCGQLSAFAEKILCDMKVPLKEIEHILERLTDRPSPDR